MLLTGKLARWGGGGGVGLVGGGDRRSAGGADLGLHLRELLAALGRLDIGGYLAAAVDNRRVVPVAEETADQLEGELGVLAEEVHGDVAGLSPSLGPAGGGGGGGWQGGGEPPPLQ